MGFAFQTNTTIQGTTSISVPGGWAVFEDEGIKEANPATGPVATVRFHLYDYADRYSFVSQILGQWGGTPPNGGFTYQGPYLYPPAPYLFCTDVTEILPFGKPAPIAKDTNGNNLGIPWLGKKECIVTAVFGRPPWQPFNTGYFSIAFDGSFEFFTVPGTTYRFQDGTPTAPPLGLLIPEATITVTRYRMGFLPDAYCIPLYGQVNNNPFNLGWTTYAAGTLLFAGFSSQIEANPLGSITYTAGYRFMYRSINWNWDFHPNRTTGWALVTDGNGQPRYPGGNFDTLP